MGEGEVLQVHDARAVKRVMHVERFRIDRVHAWRIHAHEPDACVPKRPDRAARQEGKLAAEHFGIVPGLRAKKHAGRESHGLKQGLVKRGATYSVDDDARPDEGFDVERAHASARIIIVERRVHVRADVG